MSYLEVSIDSSELERLKRLLQNFPKKAKQAAKTLRQSVMRKAKEFFPQEVSRVYYITAGRVRKLIHISGTRLTAQGKRLNIIDYRVSPKTPGKRRKNGIRVGVKRKGGLKRIKSGFVISSNYAGRPLVMVRYGRERMDIEPLTAPAVPQLMANPQVQEAFTERIKEEAINQIHIMAGRILT